jgi:hypothetical protein
LSGSRFAIIYFLNDRLRNSLLKVLSQAEYGKGGRGAVVHCRIKRTAPATYPGAVFPAMSTSAAGTFWTHAATNACGVTESSAASNTSYFFHMIS